MLKRVAVTLVVIVAVVASAVVLMTMTPIGWRLSRRIVEVRVSESTGLALTVGSLEGNLLRNATLRDVGLADGAGNELLRVGTAHVSYRIGGLLSKRLEIQSIRLDSVYVVLRKVGEGGFVGWSGLASDTTAVEGDRWDVDVRMAELEHLSVTYEDTATGLTVMARDLAIAGAGGPGDYSADVRGAIEMSARGMVRPAVGTVSAQVRGNEDRVTLDPVRVSTDLADADAAIAFDLVPRGSKAGDSPAPIAGSDIGDGALRTAQIAPSSERPGAVTTGRAQMGGLGLPMIEASIAGTTDLGSVAEFFALEDMTGDVSFRITLDGPGMEPRFHVSAVCPTMAAASLAVSGVEVMASGVGRSIELELARADLFGGSTEWQGDIRMDAAEHDEERRFIYNVRGRADGINLRRLGSVERPGAPNMSGIVSMSITSEGTYPGIDGVLASVRVDVADLAIAERALGDVTVAGDLARGLLLVDATALGTDLHGEGAVTEAGVESLAFRANVPDLSVPGSTLGVRALSGRGGVTATVRLGGDAPFRFVVDARFPEVGLSGYEVGPVSVHASGTPQDLSGRFEAVGQDLSGSWSVFEDGYRAKAEAEALDFSAFLVGVSPECYDLQGTMSGTFAASGSFDGNVSASGVVTALSLSAGSENLSLVQPFSFEATEEAVALEELVLDGTIGHLEATGLLALDGSSDLSLGFSDVDLNAIGGLSCGKVPRGSLEGTAEGVVTYKGRRGAPQITSGLVAENLVFGDAVFGRVAAKVVGDSTRIDMDVSLSGGGAGSFVARGSIPIDMDARGLPALNGTREFDASFECSEFDVRLKRGLVPSLKGDGRIAADGELWVRGRADSLGLLNGKGTFRRLSVTLDELGFSVSDTLDIEVAAGDMLIAPARVEFVRSGVLGREPGGALVVGGRIRRDGTLRLDLKTSGLSVARLVSSWMPPGERSFDGQLGFTARVEGEIRQPTVDFSWELKDPLIFGFGFDRSAGLGRFEPGLLRITRAELRAGSGALRVSGDIPIPERGRAGTMREDGSAKDTAPSEFDLIVSTDDFRLERLRTLPPELKNVQGTVSVDVKVTGPADEPDIEGRAQMTRGRISLYLLEQPVRDLGFDVAFSEGVLAVRDISARLGDGRIDASGFGQLSGPMGNMFWLKSKIRGAEVDVKNTFEGRFSADLEWTGSTSFSHVSGDVNIEKLDVIYQLGLLDIVSRRPAPVMVRRSRDYLSNIALDLTIDIEDEIRVENKLVNLGMVGGFKVGGSAMWPVLTGSLLATEGSFKYFENKFDIEILNVAFTDPTRRDPYVDIVGTTEVESRSGERFAVTFRLKGFAFEAVPELTSTPHLSEPDIFALLTFGDTVGSLASGQSQTGSSRDNFADLARSAFMGSLVGLAEQAAAEFLRLDTVILDSEAAAAGEFIGSDVTVGKELWKNVEVVYKTQVGPITEYEVLLNLKLTDWLSLATQTAHDGNHALDLNWHLRFK